MKTDAEIMQAAREVADLAWSLWGIRWAEHDYEAWLWELSGFGLSRADARRVAKEMGK